MISAISPHTLTVRPVVDTADRVYEVVARDPHEATSVVVDGRVLCTLKANDRVRVERSRASFQLIEVRGHSLLPHLAGKTRLEWRDRRTPQIEKK